MPERIFRKEYSGKNPSQSWEKPFQQDIWFYLVQNDLSLPGIEMQDPVIRSPPKPDIVQMYDLPGERNIEILSNLQAKPQHSYGCRKIASVPG